MSDDLVHVAAVIIGIVLLVVLCFSLGVAYQSGQVIPQAGHPDCQFTCDNLMQK